MMIIFRGVSYLYRYCWEHNKIYIILLAVKQIVSCIYAIFTTKNINRILPTIISRCQVIELKPDNKEVLKEKLIAKGYEEEKASVLSYIIKDDLRICFT